MARGATPMPTAVVHRHQGLGIGGMGLALFLVDEGRVGRPSNSRTAHSIRGPPIQFAYRPFNSWAAHSIRGPPIQFVGRPSNERGRTSPWDSRHPHDNPCDSHFRFFGHHGHDHIQLYTVSAKIRTVQGARTVEQPDFEVRPPQHTSSKERLSRLGRALLDRMDFRSDILSCLGVLSHFTRNNLGPCHGPRGRTRRDNRLEDHVRPEWTST